MSVDTELEVWRGDWQSEKEIPVKLRRMVERQSRWMKLGLILNLAVTIAMGGWTTGWAVQSPQPDIVLLACATWVFIAAAWASALSTSRGVWRPSALNTADFIGLSIRRCRGGLKATVLAPILFVVEIVFCLAWVYQHSPAQRAPVWRWLLFSSPAIDFVWVFTIAFCVFLIWYRKKKHAELAYLLDLGRDG